MPVYLTCSTCGKPFAVPPSRSASARYCSNDCRPRTERSVRPDGYVWVWAPDHPDAYVNGRIAEHRLVAERMIGRRLRASEDVHHINGDRSDNRPENLEVLDHGTHSRLHRETGRWAVAYARCRRCGTTEIPHVARGLCQSCYDTERRPRPARFAWALRHERCISCGTQSTRHYAKGLCVTCYNQRRR